MLMHTFSLIARNTYINHRIPFFLLPHEITYSHTAYMQYIYKLAFLMTQLKRSAFILKLFLYFFRLLLSFFLCRYFLLTSGVCVCVIWIGNWRLFSLYHTDRLTADMQMGYDDAKDVTFNASNIGNSSSLNNINSIVNPTINANKTNGHIQSTMMMSHMI